MKKIWGILFSVLCAVIVVWLTVFVTDAVRTVNLKEPIFAVPPAATADDGGSGTFRGLGYTVEVEKHLDSEFGLKTVSVEMKMFGKVVAAAIE